MFYVGLALLFCHELDAVARHEWRMMPVLGQLSDPAGLAWFVVLHLPLFAGLMWLTAHRSRAVRTTSQLGVDAFLVVHAGLHFALSGDARYEFEPPVETLTVYGGAVVGIAHAALIGVLRPRGQKGG